MRNLVTDVEGVLVGQADDPAVITGVSVVLFEEPAICAVDVRGGAPGTRETDALALERTVDRVDAVVLSGGSAFGLEAAAGVMADLASSGRGFQVGSARVPIVPSAILFDLLNGGDKAWGAMPPYRDLGRAALKAAARDMALGTAGAGAGATTATLKGGIGSASVMTANGYTVGALVAVNAVGSVTIGERPYFWAAPFEIEGEFGGKGWPARITPDMLQPRLKGRTPMQATTIAVVATDAALTKAQARHVATMAHDGMARAIYPAHGPLDGDTIFSAATGRAPRPVTLDDVTDIGVKAADVLARAIARGVYEASTGSAGATTVPAYRQVWA